MRRAVKQGRMRRSRGQRRQACRLLVAAALAVGWPRLQLSSAAEPAAESAARAELVAAGAALFVAHRCGECHAPADAPGPAAVHVPLANIGARYTASELEDFLAAPPPAMPRFDLGDLELRALAAYLIAGER